MNKSSYLLVRSITLIGILATAQHSVSGQQTFPTITFPPTTVGTTSTPVLVPGCCVNQDRDPHIWAFNTTSNFQVSYPGTTCPNGTIDSGQRCVVYLVFRPQQPGPINGTLNLTDFRATFNPVDNWPLTGVGVAAPPPAPSRCDITNDSKIDVSDVQTEVNLILQQAPPPHGDINGDGRVNVIDLQRVVNAVLGFGCNTAQ